MERGRPQSSYAADDGTDPSPFATAEDSAQQRTSSCSDRGVLDAFPAPAT